MIDPKTNHVIKTIDLGAAQQPYGVAFGRSGRRAYVTNWMGRSVSVRLAASLPIAFSEGDAARKLRLQAGVVLPLSVR